MLVGDAMISAPEGVHLRRGRGLEQGQAPPARAGV